MAAPLTGTAYDDRRSWMAILARARPSEIAARLESLGPLPEWRRLRGPETGLVMVRGRAGGGGTSFNLGEMTVTRCSVRTEGDAGYIGHSYVAGRDEGTAELAAVVDALMQDPARSARVRGAIIAPLAAVQRERRESVARKAAATRVDFFSMRTTR